MKTQYLITVIFLFTLLNTIFAQTSLPHCTYNAILHKKLMETDECYKERQEYLASIQANASKQKKQVPCSSPLAIPVAVHFAGEVTCADPNCLLDAVNAQIEQFNKDFGATNADLANFQNYVDCGVFEGVAHTPTDNACVQFCLATQNHPVASGLVDGQPAITMNENTWTSTSSVNAPDWVGYLNIFVSDPVTAGYSTTPSAAYIINGNANGDGCWLNTSYLSGSNFNSCESGAVVGSQADYFGRWGTHIVGHYLGLEHLWGSAPDNDNASCTYDDDISDTPPQAQTGSSYNVCSSGLDAYCSEVGTLPTDVCSGQIPMTMNFMDYGLDACRYMFTQEQVTVMNSVANTISWKSDATVCGTVSLELGCTGTPCNILTASEPVAPANTIFCQGTNIATDITTYVPPPSTTGTDSYSFIITNLGNTVQGEPIIIGESANGAYDFNNEVIGSYEFSGMAYCQQQLNDFASSINNDASIANFLGIPSSSLPLSTSLSLSEFINLVDQSISTDITISSFNNFIALSLSQGVVVNYEFVAYANKYTISVVDALTPPCGTACDFSIQDSCPDTDGSVTVTITPVDDGPYDVTVNGSPTDLTFTAQQGAILNILLESGDCTAADVFTVRSAPTVSVSQDCPIFDTATGSSSTMVHFDISGGFGSYTIAVNGSNLPIGTTSTNLSAGSYTVTVTDENECATNTTFEINDILQITLLKASSNLLVCGEGDVVIVVDGPTPETTYDWYLDPDGTISASGTISGNTFSNNDVFGADAFYVIGTTENGCVTEPLGISVYHYTAFTTSCETICNEDGTYTVTCILEGGRPDTFTEVSYTANDEVIDGTSYSVTLSNDETFTVVFDDGGSSSGPSCEPITKIYETPCTAECNPDAGTLASLNTDFFCTSTTIEVNTIGATVDYELVYLVTSGTTVIAISSDGQFNGLGDSSAPTSYEVWALSYRAGEATIPSVGGDVSELDGCFDLSSSNTFVVLTPITIEAVSQCSPTVGGNVIVVTVTGGRPQFDGFGSYLINFPNLDNSGQPSILNADGNGSTGTIIDNDNQPFELGDTVTISVFSDGALCQGGPVTVIITEPCTICSETFIQDLSISCPDPITNLADLTISIEQGTPPFQVSINEEAFQEFMPNTTIENPLSIGDNKISVLDDNDCVVDTVITVEPLINPNIVIDSSTLQACGTDISIYVNNPNDSIQISIGPDFSELLIPDSIGNEMSYIFMTENFPVLDGVDVHVRVINSRGCPSVAVPITVYHYHPITVSDTIIENCDNDAGTYTVSFDVEGGRLPYTYSSKFEHTGNITENNGIHTFTSDPIPFNEGYDFVIYDNAGDISTFSCGVYELGTFDVPRDCEEINCNAMAISIYMPDNSLFCSGETVNLTTVGAVDTSSYYALTYIVTDTFGIVVDINSEGIFTNLGNESLATTYEAWAVSYHINQSDLPVVGQSLLESITGCYELSEKRTFVMLAPVRISVTQRCDLALGGIVIDVMAIGGGPAYYGYGSYSIDYPNLLNNNDTAIEYTTENGGIGTLLNTNEMPFQEGKKVTIIVKADSSLCTSNTIDINIVSCQELCGTPPITSDFSINPNNQVCLEEEVVVEYTGNASLNATYEWGFGNATVLFGGIGKGPHTLSWQNAAIQTVSLVVSEDDCTTDTQEQTIEVFAALETPVITCLEETTDSITFTWGEVAGATGYEVTTSNNFLGNYSSIDTVTIDAMQGEIITISVTAIGAPTCRNSEMATIQCTTQDCGNNNAGNLSPSTQQALCEGESITVTITEQQLGSNDIAVFILSDNQSDVVNNIIATSSNGTFSSSANNLTLNQPYYIVNLVGPDMNNDGIPDASNPCIKKSNVVAIIFYEKITIEGNFSMCNNATGEGQYTLTVTGGSGNYDISDATFQQTESNVFQLNTNGSGEIDITVLDQNSSCAENFTADYACDMVLPTCEIPITATGSHICQGANGTYELVVNGGEPPYTITGTHAFTGNGPFEFTTNEAGNINVTITDSSNGVCEPISFMNIYPNCQNCGSNPGTMNTTSLQYVCAEDNIQVGTNNLEVANGDVSAYILHTSSNTTIGQVIAQNTAGTFTLNDAPTNTEYYISSIVGPDANNDNFPDVPDECTSIAAGIPVVFLEPLEAEIEIVRCYNTIGTYDIKITVSGGYASYTNAAGYTLAIREKDINLSGQLLPSVELKGFDFSTSYTFTITDAYSNGQPLCNGFADTFIQNAATCNSGSTGGCNNDVGTMTITEQQYICGEEAIDVSGGQTIVNTGDIVAYIVHTSLDNTLGDLIAQNTTGEFKNNEEYQGIKIHTEYYISRIIGPDEDNDKIPDLNHECTKIAPGTPVIFLAALSLNSTIICNNDGETYKVTLTPNGGYAAYKEADYTLQTPTSTITDFTGGELPNIPFNTPYELSLIDLPLPNSQSDCNTFTRILNQSPSCVQVIDTAVACINGARYVTINIIDENQIGGPFTVRDSNNNLVTNIIDIDNGNVSVSELQAGIRYNIPFEQGNTDSYYFIIIPTQGDNIVIQSTGVDPCEGVIIIPIDIKYTVDCETYPNRTFINLTVTGGTPPYSITGDYEAVLINENVATSIFETSIGQNSFTYTIIDGTGILTENITIYACDNVIGFTADYTKSCNIENITTINVIASGGIPPYTFTNNSTLPFFYKDNDSTHVYVQLPNDELDVLIIQVQDSGGNEVNFSVSSCTIERCPVNIVHASGVQQIGICPGNTITLTADADSEGTLLWSTGATSSAITVNEANTYGVTLTTEQGCTETDEITITVKKVTVNAGADQTICLGQTAELMAVRGEAEDGKEDYEWSTGQTGANIEVTPTQTTTYTVTMTSSTGCEVMDQVTVFVTNANVETGPDQTICLGYSTTITASGNGTFQWNTGASGSSIVVNPTQTTTYTVTVTSNGDCQATGQVTVNVTTANVVMGPDQTICLGENTTITANGNGSFQWNTGQAGSTIFVNPTQTTTYTVTVTNSAGCIATGQVTIFVTNANIVTGPDQTICSGTSATITASGDGTFQWSTGATGSTISVTPTQTTTYTVTVTNSTGCMASGQVTIFVSNLNVVIGPDQTIDSGQSATLTASGDGTFQWSTGQSGSSIVVNPTQTTTYGVTITNNIGCTATGQVTVFISSANLEMGPDQTICLGQSATLTASGDGTLQWNTGQSGSSIVVTPTQTTTYTVTATGGAATGQVTVFVTNANIVTGPDQTICSGTSATITASGDGTFQWSTGATGSTISVTPTQTTTYTVTVTNSAGCMASGQVTVFVSNPTVVMGQNQTINLGESATLTTSGDGTFQWSTGQTGSSIVVTPTQTTTYTVTLTNGAGCTGTGQVTVNVITTNTNLVMGPDQTICLGQSATVTASGNGTFQWSTNESGSSIIVTPIQTTTYTVTLTTATGDTAIGQVTVLVTNANVVMGPDQTICLGQSATITASGDGTFQWNTGATGSSIVVTPIQTTTYTVTLTNNAGCTATGQVTVFVTNANVVMGPDQTICLGSSATLTASGDGTFQWNTGQSGSSIVVNPTQTTTYTVTVTNSAGCTATGQVTVFVTNANVVMGPDQTICLGQSATITASGDGTFQWNTGATGSSIVVTPIQTTTYTVTLTNNAGCTATGQVTVFVTNANVVMGPDQTICLGSNAILTASGDGNYQWSNGQSGASIVVNPTQTTTYSVTVTNSAGCTVTGQVTVNVTTANVVMGPDQTICVGQSATLTASGDGTFQWNTGATGSSIVVTPIQTTTYTVTLTNSAGCTATGQVTVFVTTLTVDAGENQAICEGALTSLTVTGEGTYQWSTGATSPSVIVSPSETTIYTVTVTNSAGCTATDQVTVLVSGEIGDACDDGNSCTENDRLREDCSCKGDVIGVYLQLPEGESSYHSVCSESSATLSVELKGSIDEQNVIWEDKNGNTVANGLIFNTNTFVNTTECDGIRHTFKARSSENVQSCGQSEITFKVTVLPDPASDELITVREEGCCIYLETCPTFDVSYAVKGGSEVKGDSYCTSPKSGKNVSEEIIFTVSDGICSSDSIEKNTNCFGGGCAILEAIDNRTQFNICSGESTTLEVVDSGGTANPNDARWLGDIANTVRGFKLELVDLKNTKNCEVERKEYTLRYIWLNCEQTITFIVNIFPKPLEDIVTEVSEDGCIITLKNYCEQDKIEPYAGGSYEANPQSGTIEEKTTKFIVESSYGCYVYEITGNIDCDNTYVCDIEAEIIEETCFKKPCRNTLDIENHSDCTELSDEKYLGQFKVTIGLEGGLPSFDPTQNYVIREWDGAIYKEDGTKLTNSFELTTTTLTILVDANSSWSITFIDDNGCEKKVEGEPYLYPELDINIEKDGFSYVGQCSEKDSVCNIIKRRYFPLDSIDNIDDIRVCTSDTLMEVSVTWGGEDTSGPENIEWLWNGSMNDSVLINSDGNTITFDPSKTIAGMHTLTICLKNVPYDGCEICESVVVQVYPYIEPTFQIPNNICLEQKNLILTLDNIDDIKEIFDALVSTFSPNNQVNELQEYINWICNGCEIQTDSLGSGILNLDSIKIKVGDEIQLQVEVGYLQRCWSFSEQKSISFYESDENIESFEDTTTICAYVFPNINLRELYGLDINGEGHFDLIEPLEVQGLEIKGDILHYPVDTLPLDVKVQYIGGDGSVYSCISKVMTIELKERLPSSIGEGVSENLIDTIICAFDFSFINLQEFYELDDSDGGYFELIKPLDVASLEIKEDTLYYPINNLPLDVEVQYIEGDSSTYSCISKIMTIELKKRPPLPNGEGVLDSLTFCLGEQKDLYFNGNGFTLYSDTVLSNIIFSGNNPVILPDFVGTYYLTQTVNGCESSARKITIEDVPEKPMIGGLQKYCIGEEIVITIENQMTGSEIYWYDSDGVMVYKGDILIDINAGSYFVMQKMGNCESEKVPFVVQQIPYLGFKEAYDTIICNGEKVNLNTLLMNNEREVQWERDGTPISNLFPDDQTPTGIYVLECKPSDTSCVKATKAQLQVLEPLKIDTIVRCISKNKLLLTINVQGGLPPYEFNGVEEFATVTKVIDIEEEPLEFTISDQSRCGAQSFELSKARCLGCEPRFEIQFYQSSDIIGFVDNLCIEIGATCPNGFSISSEENKVCDAFNYIYSIDGGETYCTDNRFPCLEPGVYSVYVGFVEQLPGQINCPIDTSKINLLHEEYIGDTVVTIEPLTTEIECIGRGVEVKISGGVPFPDYTYRIKWSNNTYHGITYFEEGQSVLYVEITDFIGCVKIDSISISDCKVGKGFLSPTFSLYPNPTPGKLLIKSAEKAPLNLHLYNLQGTQIYCGELNGEQILNLEQYPKGLYFIKVSRQNGGGVQVKKLIKY